MTLAELIIEGTEDKLTANLMNFLKGKFKAEKNVKFELEKIQGLRKMFNIPDDVNDCIRMTVKYHKHLASARKYLETVIGQRFPEDNILNVTVRSIETEDGCFIVLQQDLNEELHPLLRKAYDQIYEILATLNEDWKKDFGGKEHYLYDLSANFTDTSLRYKLTQNSNFDSEHFLQALDYIKEALEEEGYINGIMPLDVDISKPITARGDGLCVVITVTRSGRS